jgi:hypothetical protein
MMALWVSERETGMEHLQVPSPYSDPPWVPIRTLVYHYDRPQRGHGWLALYQIDGEIESEVRRAMLPLWRVRREEAYDYCWYARSTPALPFICLRFWLEDRAVWWVVVEILCRRLHWIRRPPMGLVFEWRRDFRPLAWILRALGRTAEGTAGWVRQEGDGDLLSG